MRLARTRFITTLVLLLTAIPRPSRALVFGHSRVTVATNPGSIYSPIGIVYGTPEAGYATAFVIDDCHALTVQHVFGASRSAIGRRAYFAANVSGPFAMWRTSVATVIKAGGLERFGNSKTPDRTTDWALLKLHRCLGKTFGHVTLTSRLPVDGEIIEMAGYPGDRPLSAGLALDPSCRIREVRGAVLLHDCASLPGNSGSPLYRITDRGGRPTLEVFAINTAAHWYSGPGADLVLPVEKYIANYANFAATLAGPIQAVENEHSHRLQ